MLPSYLVLLPASATDTARLESRTMAAVLFQRREMVVFRIDAMENLWIDSVDVFALDQRLASM